MINDKLVGGFYSRRRGAAAGVAQRLRSNYSNSGCKLHRTLALVRYLVKLSRVQRRPTIPSVEGYNAITYREDYEDPVAGIISAIYFENGISRILQRNNFHLLILSILLILEPREVL